VIGRLFLKLALVMVVLIIAAILNRQKAEESAPTIVADNEDEMRPSFSPDEDQGIPMETTEPDDLTEISGIGPKISGILIEAGITSYAQLAQTDEDALNQIMGEAGLRLGNPASWIAQAKELTS
jgi:predicted flap endonuclease-1-like 5' DNA nuclease